MKPIRIIISKGELTELLRFLKPAFECREMKVNRSDYDTEIISLLVIQVLSKFMTELAAEYVADMDKKEWKVKFKLYESLAFMAHYRSFDFNGADIYFVNTIQKIAGEIDKHL